jgi:hypothetical protein
MGKSSLNSFDIFHMDFGLDGFVLSQKKTKQNKTKPKPQDMVFPGV